MPPFYQGLVFYYNASDYSTLVHKFDKHHNPGRVNPVGDVLSADFDQWSVAQ